MRPEPKAEVAAATAAALGTVVRYRIETGRRLAMKTALYNTHSHTLVSPLN